MPNQGHRWRQLAASEDRDESGRHLGDTQPQYATPRLGLCCTYLADRQAETQTITGSLAHEVHNALIDALAMLDERVEIGAERPTTAGRPAVAAIVIHYS